MSVDYGVTLTWDEWKTMGLLLSRCRDDLVHASVKTSKKMGKTSKYTKSIQKRLKRINLACSDLDEIVFNTFPEKDTQTLCNVMYPGSSERVK